MRTDLTFQETQSQRLAQCSQLQGKREPDVWALGGSLCRPGISTSFPLSSARAGVTEEHAPSGEGPPAAGFTQRRGGAEDPPECGKLHHLREFWAEQTETGVHWSEPACRGPRREIAGTRSHSIATRTRCGLAISPRPERPVVPPLSSLCGQTGPCGKEAVLGRAHVNLSRQFK